MARFGLPGMIVILVVHRVLRWVAVITLIDVFVIVNRSGGDIDRLAVVNPVSVALVTDDSLAVPENWAFINFAYDDFGFGLRGEGGQQSTGGNGDRESFRG